MKKLKIDMLSHATSAPAQGVASVYLELMNLMEKYGKDDFEIALNRHSSKMDLYHSCPEVRHISSEVRISF